MDYPGGGTTQLPQGTGVGAVHIAVTDGERARRFYEDVVGLALLSDEPGFYRMGAGDLELVVLHPGALAPVPRGTTGLYHLAIVVPGRKELARAISRISGHRWPQSPTDHVMTKSDYLWDPDGNGIEIYTETPEDGTWFFTEDGFEARDRTGAIRSGRDPIDLDDLFSELDGTDDLTEPMPRGTKMGHVHLHVRDLAEAVDFYSGLIGFDVMGRSDRLGMAFVSAGGYHHHVGLNVWAGRGAPSPPDGAAGLVRFTIEVPTEAALEGVAGRLSGAGVDFQEIERGLVVRDPSANGLQVVMPR